MTWAIVMSVSTVFYCDHAPDPVVWSSDCLYHVSYSDSPVCGHGRTGLWSCPISSRMPCCFSAYRKRLTSNPTSRVSSSQDGGAVSILNLSLDYQGPIAVYWW